MPDDTPELPPDPPPPDDVIDRGPPESGPVLGDEGVGPGDYPPPPKDPPGEEDDPNNAPGGGH